MADNMKDLNCPACGKKMQKIFISDAGVNLDICIDGCGGIYFDNREFAKFDEKHENMEDIENAYQNKSFDKPDENKTRFCPVCAHPMVKNHASAKHQVEVDECYACGGKFLDFGELEKIREEYNTEADRAKASLDELNQKIGAELISEQAKYNKMIAENIEKQKHWLKKFTLTPAQIKVIKSFSENK